MNAPSENGARDMMYRRIKADIDKNHPRGWFVAISNDEVIGAEPDFHSLEAALRKKGHDPRQVQVVEAGADYPENVTIFI